MKYAVIAVLFLMPCLGISQSFVAGDRVDVYATDKKYYAATVVEAANSQLKVRYIGYAAEQDAWVKEDNVVRGGAKGDKIIVVAASGTFYGTIEEVMQNNYKVQYDGFPESYTLTRQQFSFVSSIDDTRKNIAKAKANTNTNNNTGLPAASVQQPKQTTTPVSLQATNGIFSPGTKLLGLEGKTWYAATVLEYSNGKYKVKWDNYNTEALLSPDQVKLKPTLPADKARAVSGKLYLRSLRSVLSGYTDLEWFFFGDNGVVIHNPKFGTNPVNPTLEQTENFNNVGTYTVGKTTLDVNWLSGHKTAYPLTMKGAEIFSLDGGIMVRQKGLPDGYKIDGTYDGSVFFADIKAGSTYTFRNDGTVSLSTIATAGVEGAATGNRQGKYQIKGNTLTMNFTDGSKIISNIGILEGSTSLIIDNKWMKKI